MTIDGFTVGIVDGGIIFIVTLIDLAIIFSKTKK